jgi:predicted Zn-dependent protease
MQLWEAGDKTAAGAQYQQGEALAREAWALESVRVEGNFWRAVCGLEAAHARGAGASLLALGRAEKQMERAAAIDETYHYAGPKRVLGRITQVRPLLLGGSLTRALAFYERALQIAPDNSTTLLYYADALLYHKEPGPARRALKRILAQHPTSDWVWETARDQKTAEEWLRRRLD